MATNSFDFEDALRNFRRNFGGGFTSTSTDGEEPGFATLFAPVDPWNRFPLLAPIISVVGATAVILFTGIAATSLVVMSFALMAVWFLLSEVFGYEVVPPGRPR